MRREIREIAEEAVKKLKERYGGRLISVVLYGSVARGEDGPRSDLDLFIVLKGPFEFIPMRREVYDTVSKVRKRMDISPLIMDLEKVKKLQPIHFELYADGVILYDRDNTMKTILSKVGKIIKSLGSKRYRTKDGCYGWILKENIKPGEVIDIEL